MLDLKNFWELSGAKIRAIDSEYDVAQGSPVFTDGGKYTTRGWTEWTQGFQYGSAAIQFEVTGDEWFLEYAKKKTIGEMAPHVSHFGVHDHGFNNVSTYGNLLRLMNEGTIPENTWERDFYELALKVSGAAQARRWSPSPGYIYSFNGPHSLFVDTIRSCRSLFVAHLLGHKAMDEGDKEISLIGRALTHIANTAKYNVYYGEGRDSYDTAPGRTTHEAIFNTNDGQFRCPNAQQGFSGFTTWTRGLAWAMLGFAETLELLSDLPNFEEKAAAQEIALRGARATCDFYLANTASDGIPYWDTGAPNMHALGDYQSRPSEPDNAHEPIDSSAAAIGAQGLIRLGRYLQEDKYTDYGLKAAASLFSEPYLSTDPTHQGLTLHSIYHRPNGWDTIPPGKTVPQGESSMWGDYHARELALLIGKIQDGEDYRYYHCARV